MSINIFISMLKKLNDHSQNSNQFNEKFKFGQIENQNVFVKDDHTKKK